MIRLVHTKRPWILTFGSVDKLVIAPPCSKHSSEGTALQTGFADLLGTFNIKGISKPLFKRRDPEMAITRKLKLNTSALPIQTQCPQGQGSGSASREEGKWEERVNEEEFGPVQSRLMLHLSCQSAPSFP